MQLQRNNSASTASQRVLNIGQSGVDVWCVVHVRHTKKMVGPHTRTNTCVHHTDTPTHETYLCSDDYMYSHCPHLRFKAIYVTQFYRRLGGGGVGWCKLTLGACHVFDSRWSGPCISHDSMCNASECGRCSLVNRTPETVISRCWA